MCLCLQYENVATPLIVHACLCEHEGTPVLVRIILCFIEQNISVFQCTYPKAENHFSIDLRLYSCPGFGIL